MTCWPIHLVLLVWVIRRDVQRKASQLLPSLPQSFWSSWTPFACELQSVRPTFFELLIDPRKLIQLILCSRTILFNLVFAEEFLLHLGGREIPTKGLNLNYFWSSVNIFQIPIKKSLIWYASTRLKVLSNISIIPSIVIQYVFNERSKCCKKKKKHVVSLKKRTQ